MDFGKLRYEQSKKKPSSKSGGELKEIGVSLKISDHDLGVKIKQAKKFLERGNKVKFNLVLRGREKTFENSLAINLLDKISSLLSEDGQIEQKSKSLVGNKMFVIISALRGKAKREAQKKKI